jgi:hypothetical protein
LHAGELVRKVHASDFLILMLGKVQRGRPLYTTFKLEASGPFEISLWLEAAACQLQRGAPD